MFEITKINRKQYKKIPNFQVKFGTLETKYGHCCVGFYEKALCFLKFYDGNEEPTEKLKHDFPKATIMKDQSYILENAGNLFEKDSNLDLGLFLIGTEFETSVWKGLLQIKRGQTISYEGLALQIGRHKAVRAVARAVAKNYISYLIPCHRVISKSGALHKYGGGVHRKSMLLKDEGAI